MKGRGERARSLPASTVRRGGHSGVPGRGDTCAEEDTDVNSAIE